MNTNKIASLRLYNLFLAYKNRPFIFVQRNGNFGDYLIWKGAEKLAKNAGIVPQVVDFKEFLKSNYHANSVVYIHGGGGSNIFWTDNGVIDSLLKALTTHPGVVILGPETFYAGKESFKEMMKTSLRQRKAERIYVFTRDKNSYLFVKNSLPEGINLELDHDTALNLSASDLDANLVSKYTLYAIRQDKEAVDITDKDFFAVWVDPILHCHTFYKWLVLHAQAKKIITNRLHSAVIGSILGKPTILLPNNYHKNRAVWEHSLEQRGVLWSENIELGFGQQMINKLPVLKKIFNSYKFQGTLQVFYGVR